ASGNSAAVDIPEDDLAVDSSGDNEIAVGKVRNGVHAAGVSSLKQGNRLPGLHVPDPHRRIVAGPGEQAPPPMEGEPLAAPQVPDRIGTGLAPGKPHQDAPSRSLIRPGEPVETDLPPARPEAEPGHRQEPLAFAIDDR